MIRLLFTSGRGPAECRIALANALTVLEREAEAAGVSLDLATSRDPDGHGPASAIARIDGGAGAAALAGAWTGSILWVARSPVRPHHKRKNWFVGVLRLADEPAGAETAPEIDPRDVHFEALRAGGPGGQHQNKTESAIRAVHIPTGRAVVAREERSQHRNKALALKRLAAQLALAKELAAIADSQAIQLAHDRLERGRPVRTFEGEGFTER